jgi:hypothetical protein
MDALRKIEKRSLRIAFNAGGRCRRATLATLSQCSNSAPQAFGR